MRIFLPIFFFCLIIQTAVAQQYSHYNTGTVRESFENTSVSSFIPDSSRSIAFNFFVPNLTGNFYLTGDAQVPLKSRAFLGRYTKTYLRVGEGRVNRTYADANVYSIMLRIFGSLDGNTELGFSTQTRAEGRGLFSDESVGIFNGASFFPQDSYSNIFNDNIRYQAYHQIGFSYRENINKKVSFGFKISALLGIEYQNLDIDNSQFVIDRPNDRASLGLAGTYRINYTPGDFTRHDLLPTLRNPGAGISFGTTIKTRDNFVIQANVKDLGFIHWSARSNTYRFADFGVINELSGRHREDSIYNTAERIVKSNPTVGSFVTATNAKFEISANKTYWINPATNLRYSPTLIVSKEMLYNGIAAALVNPVYYKNYSATITASYETNRIFSMGGQLMVKTPNVEFFLGTERLIPSTRLLIAANGNDGQVNRTHSYTGADVFMGFAVKFGKPIEHPMNASYIPMGEPKGGFFTRLWHKIFNKGEDNY
ncbi:hypothetical protein FPZ43_04240 [Mucilaginibacter pallidiroseus]|uniref:DUF5723 domain-containing protein n=1 Tax=Mucilaginibacter pallidiroseus TaxID=2599295 RepID=A0A563UK99_9SPHI|nr:DUF5723 family protein [Mucilaginibacter pallidiroseus]TWR31689.1 hypothetical protein FPZ43_04240 [Mucilaginibacter pallidiroseus]